jgi:biotin operon repressor
MADLRCCDFRWYSRDAEQFPPWLDYTTDQAGRHRKSNDKFLKFAMASLRAGPGNLRDDAAQAASAACGHHVDDADIIRQHALIISPRLIGGALMSRAQRQLDLIQLLRGYRRPVSGAVLAEALGTSRRTLYRDIETLNAQGAQIDGEPGVGYVLRPGFMLPPLMFSEDEIEAIVLGSRWVADRTDAALSARSALARYRPCFRRT